MQNPSAFVAARLQYQYFFGAALWLVWLGSIVAGGGIFEHNGLRFGIDYIAFYSAGQMVLEGQSASLYDPDAVKVAQRQLYDAKEESIMEFLNPPFFALLLAPFAALPFVPSLLAWTAFSLGVFCLGLVGLEGKLRLATVTSVLCFYPIFYAVVNGQNSLITAGLLGVVYGLMRRDRPFLAGLAASLILYKPHLFLGVGLLWLVQARRWWPALLGLVCGGSLLLVVTWLAMPEALSEYRELSQIKLANWIYRADYPTQMQYTIRGLVLTLLPGRRFIAEPVQYLSWAVGTWALWAFCRRQSTLPLTYAMAVAIGACIAPYMLLYDWAILVVPAILLWRDAPGERDFWIWPLLAIWLAAPLGRPLNEMQLQHLGVAVHVAYVVLVLATVAVWKRAIGSTLPDSEMRTLG